MVKRVCKERKDESLLSKFSQGHYKEIIKTIKPPELMKENYLRFLQAYHTKKDKRLYLEEPFSTGKHVRLLRVKGENLVMKWYESGSRTTAYENGVYSRLKSIGCPLPYFSTSYEFWGHPVLVMERLEKLGKAEDPYKLGVEVLGQLRFLHSFGVHCDIKPDNIMKRVKDGRTEYFLIDYGGVSQEKLEYGYKRWIWTSKWTSQAPHTRKQVVTPRHDLKELGFTVNFLRYRNVENPRKDFKGRMKDFMERVKKIDKKDIRPRDYDDLIKILSR